MQEHNWSVAIGVAPPVLDKGGVVGEVAKVMACIRRDADVFVLLVEGLICDWESHGALGLEARMEVLGEAGGCTMSSDFHRLQTSSVSKLECRISGAPYSFSQNVLPSNVSPSTSLLL